MSEKRQRLDQFELARFVDAQEESFDMALEELQRGQKQSHWMWFIFPQLKELGRSSMARHFGIGSRAEAQAYWRHDLLGARLKECSELVLAVHRNTYIPASSIVYPRD